MRLLQLLFAGFIAAVALLAALCGAIVLGVWGLLSIFRGPRARTSFSQRQTAAFSPRGDASNPTGDVIDIVASEVEVAGEPSRK